MSHIRLTAWLRHGATLLATAGVLALTACGGGSGAPNNPYEQGPAIPGPLTVVPDEAVAFAGTPLILSISGGTLPTRRSRPTRQRCLCRKTSMAARWRSSPTTSPRPRPPT